MSKIWFLGDSYVAQKRTAKSWTINVQEAFPEYDNENLALVASSLDYLYYTYEQRRKEFVKGDIVIMSLTNLPRLFLRDYNEATKNPRFLSIRAAIVSNDTPTESLTEEHPGYNYFESDLFNPAAHQAKVNLFLNSLQYDAMTKGIKIIVMPVSNPDYLDLEDKDSITLVTNALYPVTQKQMENKFNITARWFEHEEAREHDKTLANHLTPRNNEILANKVIRHIKTNEPIDLTTEWEYT